MKKKVYLARNGDGLYDLFIEKPHLEHNHWYVDKPLQGQLAVNLCDVLAKQWFGLKRHLRKKTCIRGTFSVSFTPDKKKGGQNMETVETLGFAWLMSDFKPNSIHIRTASGDLLIYCRMEKYHDNEGNGGFRTVPVKRSDMDKI